MYRLQQNIDLIFENSESIFGIAIELKLNLKRIPMIWWD